MRTVSLASLAILLLSGCAGPTSPFGALSLFSGRASSSSEGGMRMMASANQARLEFYPDRQVLHGASGFSVIVEDPEGVPEDHELTLIYNGNDVTERFLARAEREYLDTGRRRLRISTKHIRVLPTRENKIEVIYRRSPEASPVISEYLPPSCSAFEEGRSIASIPEFDTPRFLVDTINRSAEIRNFNPYYVAGLIAQESGFDSRAISRNKALGLTQVTSFGEAEILKRNPSLPRFRGISGMSFTSLKMAILGGEINSSNEWRLDPVLSVQGGVDYLNYLTEYWSRPDKRALLDQSLGVSDTALSEVILASYNSGASRVSQALDRHGSRYLYDDELGEARKYVRRVSSFCHHFANRED